MNLFDWFFPEQAQAAHLRSLAENEARLAETRAGESAVQSRISQSLEVRVIALEHDLGFMALLLGSLIERLNEMGIVTRQDLQEATAALDSIDGVRDGKLDINVLRAKHA